MHGFILSIIAYNKARNSDGYAAGSLGRYALKGNGSSNHRYDE